MSKQKLGAFGTGSRFSIAERFNLPPGAFNTKRETEPAVPAKQHETGLTQG